MGMVGDGCEPELHLSLGSSGSSSQDCPSTESSRYFNQDAKRTTDIDLLIPPLQVLDFYIILFSNEKFLRFYRIGSGSSANSEQNHQQQQQQQQQQITLFYNGRICVCDVTEFQVNQPSFLIRVSLF